MATPTENAYGGLTTHTTSNGGGSAQDGVGTLPFTGFELGLFLVVGVVFLCLGLVMKARLR
jgi:hypothetical protein